MITLPFLKKKFWFEYFNYTNMEFYFNLLLSFFINLFDLHFGIYLSIKGLWRLVVAFCNLGLLSIYVYPCSTPLLFLISPLRFFFPGTKFFLVFLSFSSQSSCIALSFMVFSSHPFFSHVHTK